MSSWLHGLGSCAVHIDDVMPRVHILSIVSDSVELVSRSLASFEGIYWRNGQVHRIESK